MDFVRSYFDTNADLEKIGGQKCSAALPWFLIKAVIIFYLVPLQPYLLFSVAFFIITQAVIALFVEK